MQMLVRAVPTLPNVSCVLIQPARDRRKARETRFLKACHVLLLQQMVLDDVSEEMRKYVHWKPHMNPICLYVQTRMCMIPP